MSSYYDIYSPIESIQMRYFDDKKINSLKKLGINRIYDLIYFFPRTYDDRTNILKIKDLRGDEYAVIQGTITTVIAPPTRSGLKMVKATVSDGTGIIEIVWFQMPYLRKSLKINEEYIFIGQIKKGYIFQMTNPEFKLVTASNDMQNGEILPIYKTSKELPQKSIRTIVKNVLNMHIDKFLENIPETILKKYNILNRKEALREIHFPTDAKKLEEAKRRFAIEELLVLEMGILRNRFLVDSKNINKYILEDKKDIVKKYLDSLKFDLTKAQKKVVTDIYKELSTGKIVNRLLQGDVGSGKTVVSMLLLLYMVENSYQGVLMAPTEILATQHYNSIRKTFENLGVSVALLTGSFKGKTKEKLIENIKDGKISIIIGTHALIEENVIFNNLGLIVIDEQHRFGVMQRKQLRDKGVLSNLLVMSATPIPRSLALSIYGDLDISIINELPPGRKPIRTKWINNNIDKQVMNNFISGKLSQGKQVYYVAPLIDESDKLMVKSVIELYDEVSKNFSKYKIGMLHGRMKSADKDEIMRQFKNKELDILVSTTVIEVGVDVPNATVMVIDSAERFGLSALHQLRGRVGRGSDQSYCFMISYTDNAVSKSRLNIMESTNDGFQIAEEDLKLRKAGEIFGTKQSGISDLKFIDIIHDVQTIKLVKDTCEEYLKENLGVINNKFLEIDIEEKFKEVN